MKSSYNYRENTKASNRYQYENDNDDSINESSIRKCNEMTDSLDRVPKAKYLSEFFNKLHKSCSNESKRIKDLKSSKDYTERNSINVGIKSKSTLRNNDPKNQIQNVKKSNIGGISKNQKKDLVTTIDKSLNTSMSNINTTNVHNTYSVRGYYNNQDENLFSVTQKLCSIEEDKKGFLLDVRLCDADLLNFETNGLSTPKDIDCFSSNENSHHSDFDLSRLSELSFLEEEKKIKQQNQSKNIVSSKSNKNNTTISDNKNSSNKKVSNGKLNLNREFDTCADELLTGNKINLRKSMNCLPAKLSGKAANKSKTTKTLQMSVKKLQTESIKSKVNPTRDKIMKHPSKDSYNPDNTGNSYNREKTPTSASTRIEEKVKPTSDLNLNKKVKTSGFANSNSNNHNNNNKSTNFRYSNNFSEKESIDFENLQTTKSNTKFPPVKKVSNLLTNTSLKIKNDSKNTENIHSMKDNKINSIPLMNQNVGRNKCDDFNLDNRRDNRKPFALNLANLNKYDELIAEFEEIFGENLENFDEECK